MGYLPVTTCKINTIPSKTTIIATDIHSGASTHSHDQAMTLVSFSTIKATCKSEIKISPLPRDDVFEFCLYVYISILSTGLLPGQQGGSCYSFV